MSWKEIIKKCLSVASAPIRRNANFFVFMYLLGTISSLVTIPKYGSLYDNLFLELFVDLYLLCAILAIFPKKVRFCLRIVLYIILYSTAAADTYCFVNFGSTLNPSMLMLVGETNSAEASNFLSALISVEVLFSSVGWILLLALIQILIAIFRKPLIKLYVFLITILELASLKKRLMAIPRMTAAMPASFGILCIAVFITGLCTSWHNKTAFHKLMSGKTIGEVEHTLTEKDHAVLYLPIYRLDFSIYANQLAAHQITQLIRAAHTVKVDSCSYRSPNIVLIIGESYGRHHSQQYGYFMETTPRQTALEKSRKLTKFTDVVTCWNLTSFVFKNMLSTHVIGEKGEWCDYPLFPEVFRKAGYNVTFITNEFLPQAKEAVYDFSGGFFLNNPELSKLQFDHRNTQLHDLDDGLLKDYDDSLKTFQKEHNLTIFHLMGQHVNYKLRYRKEQAKFWASSYEEKRPELTTAQRKMLSHYDNATLYNDSIVAQIVKRFQKEDAVVIYVPDHGEECYEEDRGFICRNHSANIDWPLAHYEFEIPFWIYCSPKYIRNHRDIYRQIRKAKDKRFMTDALPHLLLYLAGIETPTYKEEYNILSPKYNEMRPRILKNSADYDQLRDEHLEKVEKETRKEIRNETVDINKRSLQCTERTCHHRHLPAQLLSLARSYRQGERISVYPAQRRLAGSGYRQSRL